MHAGKLILQLLLIGSLGTALADNAGSAAGRVVCEPIQRVHDGDTLRCQSGAQNFSVRVAGIDAPETGQGFWRVSRDALRTMVGPGAVVDCYKADRYQRQVCRVSSLAGEDAALELVAKGLAWHTVKYRNEQTPHEQERYAAAEASARAGRLGLWSQPNPQEPSECRAAKKSREKCR